MKRAIVVVAILLALAVVSGCGAGVGAGGGGDASRLDAIEARRTQVDGRERLGHVEVGTFGSPRTSVRVGPSGDAALSARQDREAAMFVAGERVDAASVNETFEALASNASDLAAFLVLLVEQDAAELDDRIRAVEDELGTGSPAAITYELDDVPAVEPAGFEAGALLSPDAVNDAFDGVDAAMAVVEDNANAASTMILDQNARLEASPASTPRPCPTPMASVPTARSSAS